MNGKDLEVKKELNADQIALIKRTVAHGIGEDEFSMFMYLARQYDLDPFLKEICAIKRRVWNDFKKDYDQIVSIMTTRDGFLTIAHKTGQFGGMESDCIYNEKGELDGAWCKVWNKSFPDHPVSVKIKFNEYCVYTQSKTGERKPQALWASKPETMAKKVAESQALRKAFNIKGLYSQEEMEAEIKKDAKTELEYAGETLKLTEQLNDPAVYEKWCEETTIHILDELATCQTTQGIGSIKKKYEKDIGQMMDVDRAYALEMIENRFQELVMEEGEGKGDPAEITPVIGEKQAKKATPEEDLAEKEAFSKDFVKKASAEINACATKAALNVWKAAAKNIEGRAKCLKEYRDYIDAMVKIKYEKLQ